MKRMFLIMAIAVSMMACRQERLTILHTNDTHSCIEPERDGGAGVLNRALLLEHLRDSIGADNVLLFDCGDFSQGSLYYNAFKGAAEIELMNAMGYDACAIGNHEFDFGMDNMARIFSMAEFPVVCANYDFAGTVCEGIVKPWAIIERAGMRIGVFGLSPDPEGLVLPVTPLQIETPEEELRTLFCKDNFKEDYRILKQEVHRYGLSIPPMVNAYMGLSPTMKIFGTAVNYDFGNVEETGLLIAVDEMQDSTRMRYIESFIREHPESIKLTSGANKVFYEVDDNEKESN